MYSLYIDTHSSKIVICLFKDGKLLKKSEKESVMQHSEYCLTMIKDILSSCNLKPKDLKELLVVNGPGSFTGVRIGVTEAKVIAYSLNVPIKVLSSLWIKAVSLDSPIKYVSLVDRHGAYIATFNENNEIIDDYKYINIATYNELNKDNKYVDKLDLDLDYEKIYEFSKNIKELVSHAVKPLYVKNVDGIK